MSVITINNKKQALPGIDDSQFQFIRDYLARFPDEILHIPAMRIAFASARIDALTEEDLQVFDAQSGALAPWAVGHNLEFLKGKSSMLRPSMLVNPLRSIDYIGANIKELKVLSVGPRTEAEIYSLVSVGFDPANIRGLDLLSYSDTIDLGDMHDMPYEDASFDVIVAGWVFSYSTDPDRAAAEMHRVARPGAIIAAGCEYRPEKAAAPRGEGEEEDKARYDSSQDILDLFGDRVGQVYFRHDVHASLRDKPGGVMAIFELFP